MRPPFKTCVIVQFTTLTSHSENVTKIGQIFPTSTSCCQLVVVTQYGYINKMYGTVTIYLKFGAKLIMYDGVTSTSCSLAIVASGVSLLLLNLVFSHRVLNKFSSAVFLWYAVRLKPIRHTAFGFWVFFLGLTLFLLRKFSLCR